MMNRALTFLLCALVLTLWSSYVGRIWQHSRPLVFLGSVDNDSAAAVEVGLRTRFYNDNGWRTYGPIYYKAQTVLRWFVSWDSDLNSSDAEQAQERRVHFFLMLINLAAAFGLAVFLARLFTTSLNWQLAFVLAWIPALFHNPVRAQMLLLAKPDFLFASLMAVAFFYFLKFLSQPHPATLRASALWLGFTSAVKLASVYFFPSYVLGLLDVIFRQKKLSWKKGFGFFAGFSAIGYFGFGFVETWDIHGTLEYLTTQSRNTSWGDLESWKTWSRLFFADFFRPSVVLLAFAMFSERFAEKARMSKRTLLLGWGLALVALFQLFSKKMVPPFDWYPMPFINVLFLMLALSLRHLPRWLIPQWGALALVIAAGFWNPSLPAQQLDSLTQGSLSCQEGIQKTYDALRTLAQQKKIVADALVPYPRSAHDKSVWMMWDMTWPNVLAKNPTALVLKKDYAAAYLPVGEGGTGQVINHTRDLKENVAFYLPFFRSEQVRDPTGGVWKKTWAFQCHFEIWELQ